MYLMKKTTQKRQLNLNSLTPMCKSTILQYKLSLVKSKSLIQRCRLSNSFPDWDLSTENFTVCQDTQSARRPWCHYLLVSGTQYVYNAISASKKGKGYWPRGWLRLNRQVVFWYTYKLMDNKIVSCFGNKQQT